MMKYSSQQRAQRQQGPKQQGNALFLVLIAVALFAALSYAIMQSNRGTGNVTSENNRVVASQVVEMPAGVRQAIEKMTITGTPPNTLTFTGAASPSDVFDQSTGGGGGNNLPPPTGACSPYCTVWTYATFTDNQHGLFVGGVGSDAPEVLAILPNVTAGVCLQIQKGLGFTVMAPPVQDTAAFNWSVITNAISQVGGLKGSPSTVWTPTTGGQEFSCVDNLGTGNFYYHVLIAQ